MSCETSTLLDCIDSTCALSADLNAALEKARQSIADLADVLEANGEAVKCVVNGPAGQSCTMPEGSELPTLAEALARLNACTIAAVVNEHHTASDGQTIVTLGATPANAWAMELALNGAICRDPGDYSLAGNTVIFTHPLSAGDLISARSFTV